MSNASRWWLRIACAVWRQRTSGLDTTRTRGTAARRVPVRTACSRPVSSSSTPGVRPARTPLTLAVLRACRTRMTVAMTGDASPGGLGLQDRLEEVLRALLPRAGEHVLGVGVLDDVTVHEDHHAV